MTSPENSIRTDTNEMVDKLFMSMVKFNRSELVVVLVVCMVIVGLLSALFGGVDVNVVTGLLGAVIGGVMTGAATLIVGPEMERRARVASRREDSYFAILELLVKGITPCFDSFYCFAPNSSPEDLISIAKIVQFVEDAWVEGVKSGDAILQSHISDLRTGIAQLRSAWQYLPAKVQHSERRVVVLLKGEYSSEVQVARQANSAVWRLIREMREYLTNVLNISVPKGEGETDFELIPSLETRKLNDSSLDIGIQLIEAGHAEQIGSIGWAVLRELPQSYDGDDSHLLELRIRSYLTTECEDAPNDNAKMGTYLLKNLDLISVSKPDIEVCSGSISEILVNVGQRSMTKFLDK